MLNPREQRATEDTVTLRDWTAKHWIVAAVIARIEQRLRAKRQQIAEEHVDARLHEGAAPRLARPHHDAVSNFRSARLRAIHYHDQVEGEEPRGRQVKQLLSKIDRDVPVTL